MDEQTAQREDARTTSGPAAAPRAGTVPLVVDMDGALIASDIVAESLIALMDRSPLQLLHLASWLLTGQAQFKSRLAQVAAPEIASLPYRRPVLDLLEQERSKGRQLVLVSGAGETLVRRVAEHVGLFDRTLGSSQQMNLTGETKAKELTELFGARGFDYVGSGWDDAPAWRQARKAIMVDPGPLLRRRIAAWTPVERVIVRRESRLRRWLEEMRWRHWLKNALVFVPLVAAHRLYEVRALTEAVLAFVAFCLCASSIYLFNDLADLPGDRAHPVKRLRPLASGRVAIRDTVLLQIALLACALAIGSALPVGLFGAMAVYYALQVAYCLQLKRLTYLDALVLSTGYCLRIVGGAAAARTPISPWLLAAALLFFFGLALLKRYAEFVALQLHFGRPTEVRGYAPGEDNSIFQAGTASGYLAVVVLGMYGYLLKDEGLHLLPVVALCALLLAWTMHVWRMARLGQITGDPVAFVYHDRASQVLAAATLAVLLFSG